MEETIPFTGISKFDIDQVLYRLHLVRFACEFESLESLDDISTIQDCHFGSSLHSLDKKKMTIRKEFESILPSEHAVYRMYFISKIGLFDSIFEVKDEEIRSTIKVDLMNCIKDLKEISSINQFLEEFSKIKIMKKIRRKYRKIDLNDEFLSQIFFTKKERKELIKIQ